MEPRNVIVWMLLPVLVVLAMSAGVQAQELREVPASEILEKIQAGEDVYLENVRITGELDISKIELETVPIARTWVEEYLGLKEKFGSVIESKITIKDSIFETDVNFYNTRFREPLNFQNISFLGKTGFGGASFGGYANFGYADFGGDADFGYASFGGYANFRYADFGGDATFWYTDFGGDADFRYASFDGDTDFRYASFDGDTYFPYASFGGDVDFWSASFDGDADFGSASFSGYTIFSSTKFNKVLFSNTKFTKVSLHDADFESMYVDWVPLKEVLGFYGPAYIKLIKNFREMEQFKDADDATYQYRRQSQANKEWSFSKLGDIFIWLSCGYGVKPWRAAAWAVAIVLIFTPFYFWRGGIKRLKENNEDEKQDASLYDAFYFSMTTFTTLGYGDLYPADRYRMAAVVIEGLVGWLILALFLVTLANVMIRP